MAHQQAAVDSGRWLLYRYDPRRAERGENPLQLDSRAPSRPLAETMAEENRFRMLRFSQPQLARQLERQAQHELDRRWALYRALASQDCGPTTSTTGTTPP
jgi:pyruvate-ferredoxin/flavodoxin oxidoreductase